MNPNIIFKPTTEKLQNAIAAIVGRAVRLVKRFTTALHNHCNLVVYVDLSGRTCCQFLKKDAFSGYHFEFKGDRCAVTNKATGDVYVVSYSPTCKWCPCESYKYSPRHEKNCKHIRMVLEAKLEKLEQPKSPESLAHSQISLKQGCPNFLSPNSLGEFKGDLKQALALSQEECSHPKIIIGLDLHYCPDCKKSIRYGTAAYEEILTRDNKPEKKSTKAIPFIEPNDVPKGCSIERTDDWIIEEYNVHAWGYKNQRGGERTLTQTNIGRLVQYPDGIRAYRVRLSATGHTFETTRDAIAYLVQVVGTSFEEIAAAYEERMAFQKKVARL